MAKLNIDGITSIDCPGCGVAFTDYDAPVPWLGILHLTARCHGCRTEYRFEVEVGNRETSVIAVAHTAMA